MNHNWVGKIAVVTGASSGIGAQVALDLAQAGLQVVGLARRRDRIEALAANASVNIHAIECDVSKIESIESAFKQIASMFGKVNILVNNAGKVLKAKVLDPCVSHAALVNVMDVNFAGVLVCTREAFKLMENHDEAGYIININSVAGHISANYDLSSDGNIYPATKHALRNHTDALRLDLAHAGNRRVRVASINPGVVKTEIFEASGFSMEESHYAIMPFLDAKDVSDAVQYLLALPANVNVTEMTIKPVGEQF